MTATCTDMSQHAGHVNYAPAGKLYDENGVLSARVSSSCDTQHGYEDFDGVGRVSATMDDAHVLMMAHIRVSEYIFAQHF